MSRPHDPVYPKLQRLSECLCELVRELDMEPLCMCGIVPGAMTAYNYIHSEGCGEADGMAWVRLTSQYPTKNFPAVNTQPQKCGLEIAAVVEVGMIRSIPLTGDGEPPDAATYQALAERQMEEAAVMRYAIVCCFGSGVILGAYTPIGPVGLALGGQWLASIPTIEDDY